MRISASSSDSPSSSSKSMDGDRGRPAERAGVDVDSRRSRRGRPAWSRDAREASVGVPLSLVPASWPKHRDSRQLTRDARTSSEAWGRLSGSRPTAARRRPAPRLQASSSSPSSPETRACRLGLPAGERRFARLIELLERRDRAEPREGDASVGDEREEEIRSDARLMTHEPGRLSIERGHESRADTALRRNDHDVRRVDLRDDPATDAVAVEEEGTALGVDDVGQIHAPSV